MNSSFSHTYVHSRSCFVVGGGGGGGGGGRRRGEEEGLTFLRIRRGCEPAAYSATKALSLSYLPPPAPPGRLACCSSRYTAEESVPCVSEDEQLQETHTHGLPPHFSPPGPPIDLLQDPHTATKAHGLTQSLPIRTRR